MTAGRNPNAQKPDPQSGVPPESGVVSRPIVEYSLRGWSDGDIERLRASLVRAAVGFRTTRRGNLEVNEADERRVDELVEAVIRQPSTPQRATRTQRSQRPALSPEDAAEMSRLQAIRDEEAAAAEKVRDKERAALAHVTATYRSYAVVLHRTMRLAGEQSVSFNGLKLWPLARPDGGNESWYVGSDDEFYKRLRDAFTKVDLNSWAPPGERLHAAIVSTAARWKLQQLFPIAVRHPVIPNYSSSASGPIAVQIVDQYGLPT